MRSIEQNAFRTIHLYHLWLDGWEEGKRRERANERKRERETLSVQHLQNKSNNTAMGMPAKCECTTWTISNTMHRFRSRPKLNIQFTVFIHSKSVSISIVRCFDFDWKSSSMMTGQFNSNHLSPKKKLLNKTITTHKSISISNCKRFIQHIKGKWN